MAVNLLTAFKESFSRDERFQLHRLRASRLALLVGVVAMGVLFWYDYIRFAHTRIDLLVILVMMAFSKLGAMAYYRTTN
jgi:hypothetical protein